MKDTDSNRDRRLYQFLHIHIQFDTADDVVEKSRSRQTEEEEQNDNTKSQISLLSSQWHSALFYCSIMVRTTLQTRPNPSHDRLALLRSAPLSTQSLPKAPKAPESDLYFSQPLPSQHHRRHHQIIIMPLLISSILGVGERGEAWLPGTVIDNRTNPSKRPRKRKFAQRFN